MKLFKEVGAEELKLEGVKTPVKHEANLAQIKYKSEPWLWVYSSVINSDKGHEWHVPEKVLGSHYFVKCHEGPGLQYDCKEHVIMEGKASK